MIVVGEVLAEDLVVVVGVVVVGALGVGVVLDKVLGVVEALCGHRTAFGPVCNLDVGYGRGGSGGTFDLPCHTPLNSGSST